MLSKWMVYMSHIFKKLFIFLVFFSVVSALGSTLSSQALDYLQSIISEKRKRYPALPSSVDFLQITDDFSTPLMIDELAYDPIFFTKTHVDIIEHFIKYPQSTHYVLKLTGKLSPYILEIIIPKPRALAIIQAEVEKTLGHLYYQHVRFSRSFSIGIGICGLISMAVGEAYLQGLKYSSCSILQAYASLPIFCNPKVMNMVALLYGIGGASIGYAAFTLPFSEYKNDLQKMIEVEKFIDNDVNLLLGSVTALKIELIAWSYLYSYTHPCIRFAAWKNNMNSVDYMKTSNIFNKDIMERIDRLKERISEKREEIVLSQVEPVIICVYKSTRLVEKHIL